MAKIKLPTQTIIPHHQLVDLIDSFVGIGQYKIIQNNEKDIKIQIVKNDRFKDDEWNLLLKECLRIFGDSVNLEYEIVLHIPKSTSGKYKTIVAYNNSFDY